MSDPTSLAAIVKSLLAAFDSGREVFCRLLAKYRSKKLRRKDLLKREEEERLLEETLFRYPQRIKDEYQGHAAQHGKRFKDGDERARTSLAHILLRLNTGLATIIEAFLIRTSKEHRLAHRSLLHLSETSSSQALRVLGQFHDRLGKSRSTNSFDSAASKRRPPSRSQSSSPSIDKKKPLVRKQFVRSKSDSAIVKVEKAMADAPKRSPSHTKKRKLSSSSIRSASAKSARTSPASSSSEWFDPLKDNITVPP